MRMPRDIGHRLLQNAIKRDLDGSGQSPTPKVADEIYIQIEAGTPFLEVVGDRGFETEIVERRGPKFPRELVNIAIHRQRHALQICYLSRTSSRQLDVLSAASR